MTVENKEIPIKFIESVYAISGNSKISVDMSKGHIASNGQSFTIDGANKGEFYEFVYQYDSSLGTLPSVEFSVPMNKEAQVDGNTDMIQNLKDRVELLEEKVKNLQGNTVGISGIMSYQYDDNGRLISRKIN